jgi:hypothetical protein
VLLTTLTMLSRLFAFMSLPERESPVKPSDLATRTVDIEHLRAEDLEYNYDKVLQYSTHASNAFRGHRSWGVRVGGVRGGPDRCDDA